jgi:glycosyltransferase involved in cell wall biosynthesis
MLNQITPVVLTYNEEPNIRRTLESLRWAERVVVVDSGSSDSTETIAKSFTNVDWHVRRFDCHRSQWEHAVRNTGIQTNFVLALDSDMSVPESFLLEMRSAFFQKSYMGAIVSFEYRTLGRALKGSVYPPQLRVFRPDSVKITQPGHTQEFAIEGSTYRFLTPLVHDDRKPLERWVSSQLSYAALEAERIRARVSYRFRDRLRELGLMPVIAGALAYVRAGGPLRGAAAVRYAHERAAYESLLAIRLMSAKLQREQKSTADSVPLQRPEVSDPEPK